MSKSVLRCTVFGALGAVLTFVLVAFVSTQYSDYTSRARTSELLFLLKEVQKGVESKIIRGTESETSEAVVREILVGVPPGYFGLLRIINNGTILARGVKDGQVLVLIPNRVGDGIEWECVGGSAKDMLHKCR